MFTIRRIPHILRGKKRCVTPSNFVFFDTETKLQGTKNTQGLGRHELWFGWAYGVRIENGKRTRETWVRFTTSAQFFAFIKTRLVQNKPLFVYAHNLGFDLPIVNFMENFKTHGIKVSFYTFNSPPTIFKCKWDTHSLTFVDTLNYWTVSLAKLGESIGIPKLGYPGKKISPALWDKYCRRDVEIIAAAVAKLCKFVVDHHCGSTGLTLASLSMSAFRYRHMKHDIYIHDRLKVLELEREAYYGGYVNCFYVGTVKNRTVYNVDINSHYPSVMRNYYPTKLIEELDNVPINKLQNIMRTKLVIARVILNTTEQAYPKRQKDKLCYCVGRFQTTLCSPELERLLKYGGILKVLKLAVYDKATIFRDFVRYFWDLRLKYIKAKQPTDAFFCKILLNSLYGKFGQRGVAWVDLTEQLLSHLKMVYKFDEDGTTYNSNNIPVESTGYYSWTPEGCEEQLYLRNILDNVQVKMPIPEHHESFPAIAAFVTSYGREFLLRLVDATGQHNCYYCDTDSLFVNLDGLKRLKSIGAFGERELGKLKVADQTRELIVRGLKDYEFEGRQTIKGIRKDAIKVGKNEYLQTAFEGIKSIVRRGGEPYVLISSLRKKLKRTYDKGRVNQDGWVDPFRLREA